MVGSSEWLDKHTDPLWLGGVSAAPGGAKGCRRGVGGGGGGVLRVQLEELERSMDSDSCQGSLRYTVSHTLTHTHSHTHHPLSP